MSEETFTRAYWIHPQLILTEPRWEDMIWDECLKEAHQEGKMPVGPVMIRAATHEEVTDRLASEHPFKRTEVSLGGETLYIAEVLVGVSLT